MTKNDTNHPENVNNCKPERGNTSSGETDVNGKYSEIQQIRCGHYFINGFTPSWLYNLKAFVKSIFRVRKTSSPDFGQYYCSLYRPH